MPLVSEDQLRVIDTKSRVEIAKKIGRLLSYNKQTKDYEQALELAHLLADDVSVSVRKSLSNQLKESSFLPKELSERIVNDVEQVSGPFLASSLAVDDEFLIDFLSKCSDHLQEKVATREVISEELTFAICNGASYGAVDKLISNDGAKLNAGSAIKVTERFPEERTMLERMAKRIDLPVAAVKYLIFKISQEYSEYLAKKFNLTSDYSKYIVSLAEQHVFCETLQECQDFEVHNYFSQLNRENKITFELLFGYIQTEYDRLFIVALAVLTKHTPTSLRDLLELDSSKVLDKLLQKCGCPRSMIGAIVIAFERQHPK